MVRYFFAGAPLVIVGAVVLLALPWLGLIALVIFALVGLVALAALAWAIVVVPYALGRAISHGRRGRGARPRPAAAPPAANVPAGATVLLANQVPKRDM
jgi:hypothetical protein